MEANMENMENMEYASKTKKEQRLGEEASKWMRSKICKNIA
jgi:hypothetical protein